MYVPTHVVPLLAAATALSGAHSVTALRSANTTAYGKPAAVIQAASSDNAEIHTEKESWSNEELWWVPLVFAAIMLFLLLVLDCAHECLKRLPCIGRTPIRGILCLIVSMAGFTMWYIRHPQLEALRGSLHGAQNTSFILVLDWLLLIGVFIFLSNVAVCVLGFLAQPETRERLFANDTSNSFVAVGQVFLGSLCVRIVHVAGWVAFLIQLGLLLISSECLFYVRLGMAGCKASSLEAGLGTVETPAGQLDLKVFCVKEAHVNMGISYHILLACVLALMSQASLLAWISAWKAGIDADLRKHA